MDLAPISPLINVEVGAMIMVRRRPMIRTSRLSAHQVVDIVRVVDPLRLSNGDPQSRQRLARGCCRVKKTVLGSKSTWGTWQGNHMFVQVHARPTRLTMTYVHRGRSKHANRWRSRSLPRQRAAAPPSRGEPIPRARAAGGALQGAPGVCSTPSNPTQIKKILMRRRNFRR